MHSLPSRNRRRPRGQRKYRSTDHRSVATESSLSNNSTALLNASSRVRATNSHGQTREEDIRSTVHRPATHPGLVANAATTFQDKSVNEQTEKIAKLSLENEQLKKRLEDMESLMQRTLAFQQQYIQQQQSANDKSQESARASTRTPAQKATGENGPPTNRDEAQQQNEQSSLRKRRASNKQKHHIVIRSSDESIGRNNGATKTASAAMPTAVTRERSRESRNDNHPNEPQSEERQEPERSASQTQRPNGDSEGITNPRENRYQTLAGAMVRKVGEDHRRTPEAPEKVPAGSIASTRQR